GPDLQVPTREPLEVSVEEDGCGHSLLGRLDEEALALAAVEVDDSRKRALGLVEGARVDLAEARLPQELVREVVRKESPRPPVPEELGDELASNRDGILIGDEEVLPVAVHVGLDSLVEVWQPQAQDPPRLEHAPKLPDYAHDVRQRDLRQRMLARDVVDARVLE